MAIRIIRSPIPSDSNLHEVEREEQILAIARKVAEASGFISQEHVDECAAKLRSAESIGRVKSPEQIADDITRRMAGSKSSTMMMAHSELDMDRIMALLEG